jgi:ATP-dependent helicase/nuclease subunit A
MTRAKDRLVVMLEKPEEKKLVSYYEKGKNTGRYITRANSFADWIFPVITGYDCMSAVFDEIGFERSLVKTDENRSFAVSELVAKAFYSNEKTENENESENVSKISDEIKERLSFAYPFASLSKIPSKISVTDIKNGKLNADDKNIIPSSDELVSPGFLSDRTVLSAEIGTAMHTFMQYADFKKCEDSVEAEARRLLESAFITGEQFGMLDFEKLSMFFESGIYKEISRAKKVNRETAFAINLPISELYEETSASEFSGESTLIQGKIDCFFEDENGRFTIIDFKTDKVSDINELSKRYSLQLHYYKRAVREMTGREDIRNVIYSFSHSDYIEL